MPGYPTDRVIVYNRDASFAFELTPDEQQSRNRIEEINGEHSLTIKTTCKLAEGMRLITQDDTGKVREHVVYKSDEGHNKGKYAVGTYLCMWSLQYDLMSSYAHEHAEPGMGSSCSSRNAVIAALDGQSLWTVGMCDVPAVTVGNGCVMIGISAWERLSLVVKHWGGEIDAEIEMDDTRVVARKVNFLAHLGSSTVTRRFDWAEDLTSIDRHEDPGPYYCRIVPLGRGQREYAEDDETEFDWPIDISEETPDGRVYIEDSESALVFRTKLPDGTWHYPTKVVKYDEDDPELLLNKAQADLHNHTRPGVSYEANVLQFARAGMDAKGVQLGDNTQCVDFGFNPDAGLTVEGRVTRLEVEELAPETKTILTIGDLATTFAQTMRELITAQTASISDGIKRIEDDSTFVRVDTLVDILNAEINATGGYWYLIPGQGTRTYDRAVSNPAVGTEATQVVEIKGGSLRIANSRTSSGDWDWKSVFVSGKIAAELLSLVGSGSSNHLEIDGDTIKFYSGNPQIGWEYSYFSGTEMRVGKGDTYHVDIKNYHLRMFEYVQGENPKRYLHVGNWTGDTSSDRIYKAFGNVLTLGNIYPNIDYYSNGHAAGGTGVLVAENGALEIIVNNTIVAHIGTALSDGHPSLNPEYSYYSFGVNNKASGGHSFCEGSGNQAYGNRAHAGGEGCKASATGSYAFGKDCECIAGNYYSRAVGVGTKASAQAQTVVGQYNSTHSTALFVVGSGTSDSERKNSFTVLTAYAYFFSSSNTGTVYVNGSVVHSSDKRLKDHVAYLGEDAADFIRALKPVRYKWKDKGGEHYGFYAQDVQEVDPHDTETVVEGERDESLDFDPLTLDYQALIAPLVAYTQQLEKRVNAQDKTIEALEARLAKLEAKLA